MSSSLSEAAGLANNLLVGAIIKIVLDDSPMLQRLPLLLVKIRESEK